MTTTSAANAGPASSTEPRARLRERLIRDHAPHPRRAAPRPRDSLAAPSAGARLANHLGTSATGARRRRSPSGHRSSMGRGAAYRRDQQWPPDERQRRRPSPERRNPREAPQHLAVAESTQWSTRGAPAARSPPSRAPMARLAAAGGPTSGQRACPPSPSAPHRSPRPAYDCHPARNPRAPVAGDQPGDTPVATRAPARGAAAAGRRPRRRSPGIAQAVDCALEPIPRLRREAAVAILLTAQNTRPPGR